MLRLLFIVFVFTSQVVGAQSILKSIPKVNQQFVGKSNSREALSYFSPSAKDSTFVGIRPIVSLATGYSSSGGATVLAFAGISYEHDTYRQTTQKWYADWSASVQIGTGASNGAVSLQNATTIGLFGSFFNKLLTVGVGYNFYNKSVLPLLGPGISLNN